jgi:TolB protein
MEANLNRRETKRLASRSAMLGVALVSIMALLGPSPSQASDQTFTLESTIVFSSSRDNPIPGTICEIYLVNPDGTDPRRLTENDDGDGLAALSPDGKKIVFDSNRNRAEGEPLNTSDLFIMNTDGTEQTLLTRGSTATWSPDSKHIAFHASASGTGLPIIGTPGAATTDSDIFVANVDDLLTGIEQPTNLTNSPDKIDDDPDWSPDGQEIVFTNRDADDPNHNNPLSAEIYALNADGTGAPEQLTFNAEEERGPAWSPDGTRIAFACRRGGPDFEICVMSADGSNQAQLTNNSVQDLTPTWSPDGQQLVFHSQVAGRNQLFVMNADGTEVTQITNTPGVNLLANWGELRVKVIG